VLAAEWVRLRPTYEEGHPQPKGWQELVRANRCEHCGAGYTQIAPFLLKREPRRGRHQFVSPFATYEPLCILPVVGQLQRHGARGLNYIQPLILPAKTPSETVTQLQVSATAGPGLLDDLASVVCQHCQVRKFHPHMRGPMHMRRAAFNPDVDFLRSQEWYGSGYSAYQEIFTSQRIARLLVEGDFTGIQLMPVAFESTDQ
jgi:hypothetical protein